MATNCYWTREKFERTRDCPECGAPADKPCRGNAVKVVTTEAPEVVTITKSAAVGQTEADPGFLGGQLEKMVCMMKSARTLAAYLENILRHPAIAAMTPAHAIPEQRHPLAQFELDNVKALCAFVRDPNGAPNPFKPATTEDKTP